MPWVSGISSSHMRPTRFLFTYAIFCAAALCLSSGANAQSDLFNWTGFYIGGNIGGLSSNYGFGPFTDVVDVDAQASEFNAMTAGIIPGPHQNVVNGGGATPFGTDSFSFPDTGTTFGSGSNQALLGGGQLGYNKQFGHWVIGVEGDFQGTSASGQQLSSGFAETTSVIGSPPPSQFNTIIADTTLDAVRKAETDWTASLRARFGYAVGPMFFYGTAGLAWTDVKVIATETASTDFFNNFNGDITAAATSPRGKVVNGFIGNQTDTNFSKTSDDVQMGWTGGVGAEWAINDKMTLGVEYRHSDYGSHTYTFASNNDVIFPGNTKVDLNTDQVTLRFNILISHFFGH
jgi:outer membrane immunogenic protein